jgi:hypothetical protein
VTSGLGGLERCSNLNATSSKLDVCSQQLQIFNSFHSGYIVFNKKENLIYIIIRNQSCRQARGAFNKAIRQ